MQINETFVYLCTGSSNDPIWGDARIADETWEKMWDYGGYTMNTSTNKLEFWNQNTIAIFNSKGHCQEVML